MLRFRTACFALTAVLASSVPLFSQTSFSDLTDAVSTLTDKAGAALPAASSMGLDWSDAWIGYLTGVPPHLGVGISTGFTTLPSDALKPLFDAMGNSLPSYATSLGGLPLPIYTFNARLGGFVLPFDLGFKVGYMPTVTVSNLGVDYLVVGGDIRYALLQDGITPGLSVGFGVNYLQSNFSYEFGTQKFDVPGYGTFQTASPKATLALSSLSYELKTQISKNLFLITPYAGAAVDLSSTKVDAKFDGTLENTDGSSLNSSQISQLNSLTSADFTSNGIEVSSDKNGIWAFRVYGGASLNLAVFQIDLKALYNFPSGNLGADLGFRFKL